MFQINAAFLKFYSWENLEKNNAFHKNIKQLLTFLINFPLQKHVIQKI